MSDKTREGQPTVFNNYTQAGGDQQVEQPTNNSGVTVDLSEISRFYETERSREYGEVMSSIKGLLSTGKITRAALASRMESLADRVMASHFAIASATFAAAAGIQGANQVLAEATKSKDTQMYILNMYSTNPEKALIADVLDMHKELAPSIQAHAGLITTAGLEKANALTGMGQYNTGYANARSIDAQTAVMNTQEGMTVEGTTNYMNALSNIMKTDQFKSFTDDDQKKIRDAYISAAESLSGSSRTTAKPTM